VALLEPTYATRARRWHSLTGIVPLGVFLVLHTLTCASLLRSDAAFQSTLLRVPMFLELFGIVLPLVYHGGYGVMIAWRERKDRSRFPTLRIATLQRVTGAIALVFVLLHVWSTSVQKWFYGASPASFYTMLEARLSSTAWSIPWTAVAYMIGIAATCFHFSAGVWSFTIAWNLSRSDRAKKRVAWTSGAVGSVLFLIGAFAVVQLATGTRIIEGPEPLPDGPDRPACSAPP
jgi:succinate dehydrogenase / fumarate reductase cytochrome b subunit